MEPTASRLTCSIRKPKVEDGPRIWDLVKDTAVLDLNSAYCYLIVCRDFSDTCAVTEDEEKLIGFVSAYIPPTRPDVLFIWQIAVSTPHRGRGIGYSLLLDLLQRDVCKDISFIETTISPINQSSRALFTALSRCLKTDWIETEGFPESFFPDGSHPPERLIRIGPFKPPHIRGRTTDYGDR